LSHCGMRESTLMMPLFCLDKGGGSRYYRKKRGSFECPNRR
jgi:hypothetical protein